MLKTRFFLQVLFTHVTFILGADKAYWRFFLMPKRMFLSTQPVKIEIFDNLVYKQKTTQLSLIQRTKLQKTEKREKEDGAVQTEPSICVETHHEEKEESMSNDSEIDSILKKYK